MYAEIMFCVETGWLVLMLAGDKNKVAGGWVVTAAPTGVGEYYWPPQSRDDVFPFFCEVVVVGAARELSQTPSNHIAIRV